MEIVSVFVVIFTAMFVQSLSGFGLALVSMPLLTAVIGLQQAAPLVAIMGLLVEIFLFVYFRQHFDIRAVGRLVAASVIGIPAGVWLLGRVDERPALILLGLVVGGYALYALLNFRLPEIDRPGWAYGLGFVAGLLGGAFNTFGPPVIIYGHCRRWTPGQFKSNLQGFFVLNSLLVTIAHLLARNYTPHVWELTLAAVPAAALGVWAGLHLDKRLSPELFRKVVLWLLVIIGLRLILGAFG